MGIISNKEILVGILNKKENVEKVITDLAMVFKHTMLKRVLDWICNRVLNETIVYRFANVYGKVISRIVVVKEVYNRISDVDNEGVHLDCNNQIDSTKESI